MTKFYEFQEGDIASFGGIEGVIEANNNNSKLMFPIMACGITFTVDGRMWHHHTEPLLKLVKKAKSKKTFWLWMTAKGFVTERMYDDKGTNTIGAKTDLTGWTKLEWSAQEFEVEN